MSAPLFRQLDSKSTLVRQSGNEWQFFSAEVFFLGAEKPPFELVFSYLDLPSLLISINPLAAETGEDDDDTRFV